ncbi:MAG: hypothetical protein RQ866_01285 [Bacteroidales bacterium]|nr:hypothetical protein [Bacteroidales bacterium]
MRNIIVIVIFISLYTFSLSAQPGYFSIAASYGFGINGITHSKFEQSAIDGNKITVTAKRLTLGSGFNYRADFRYFINEYIGLGIQGTLTRGSWQYFSSERKIVFIQYTDQCVRARGLTLAAALHIRAAEQRVMPYFSVFTGYFTGTMDVVDTVRYCEQGTTSQWEYSSLNSFCLSFAAGMDVVLNEELNLFFEMELQNMTVAPQRARLIKKNGSDQMDDIPVIEKEIVFIDEISSDYSQQPNSDLPQKELTPYFPLDSFQIRVGLRIVIGR